MSKRFDRVDDLKVWSRNFWNKLMPVWNLQWSFLFKRFIHILFFMGVPSFWLIGRIISASITTLRVHNLYGLDVGPNFLDIHFQLIKNRIISFLQIKASSSWWMLTFKFPFLGHFFVLPYRTNISFVPMVLWLRLGFVNKARHTLGRVAGDLCLIRLYLSFTFCKL